MAILNVELGERSYPIVVDSGLLSRRELFQQYVNANEVMVVTDETVAPLYLDNLLNTLSGFNVTCHVLPDGEEHKSLATLAELLDTMVAAPCSRETTLIALGGGVVGDIAGFAASCYQRGINYLQVPTTLLAQVDSAVGGKTAVNHVRGKNLIGAFYQPRCVIADTDTLSTLDSRQLSAGIAEVVKYGCIRDAELFTWLEQNIDKLCQCDRDTVSHTIIECCRNKAELVATDEVEQGDRALLNLGHTFAHAIETVTGYGTWLHGEAVSAGISLAADMSCRLGWLEQKDVERIRALLRRANLPVCAPAEMTVADFMRNMARDKKVVAGRIRLVLLKAIGEAKLVSDYPDDVLKTVLESAATG